MAPLVSIIVNCFNQSRYLERAVTSVLSQTFSDLECIIVDDGSTDNTQQVAETLRQKDPRVSYYFKQNGGLPAARNFGIQKAQGEWIQCLDADDWIAPDKISYQLSYLNNYQYHQNIVFYSDYVRVFLNEQDEIVKQESQIIGNLNTEQLIQRLLIPDFLANSPHPALQQCMLMNRNIFREQLFNENLKALGDRYFGVDILVAGVKFIYTPIIGAFYTKHKSNRTNNWDYMNNYYILFYEIVCKEHPELQNLCSIGLEYILDETVMKKDRDSFERLLKIVPLPIKLLNKKIIINSVLKLKIFYILRLMSPSFLIYEKYRVPRSKKILTSLNQILKPLTKFN